MFQLIPNSQATCPPRQDVYLSPAEVSDIIEEKLPDSEISPDGALCDASGAFRKSLKSFLLEENERRSQLMVKLGEECSVKDYPEAVNQVADKIGGITEKQLRVNNFTSPFFQMNFFCRFRL